MRVIYLLSIVLLLFSVGCEHPQLLKNTYKETPKESVVLPTLPGSSQTIMKWLRYPAISPDGKFIAFTYKGDIYIGSSDGGSVRQLTTNSSYETMPSWSPDNTKIAFVTNRHGNFDIYTVPVAGGVVTRVTKHSSPDIWPTWSPDGTEIYFTASRIDSQSSVQFPSRSLPEFYKADLATNVITQVLTIPAEMASISSDGKKILYTDKKGYENRFRKHHTSSVTRDVWVYDRETKNFTKLSSFKGEDRNGVWSEKGDSIYYLSEKSGTFNVWNMGVDGKNSKQITTLKTHPVRSLSISTSGLLAFSYNGEIYTDKPGEQPKKLVYSLPAENRVTAQSLAVYRNRIANIALSPDGKEAVFTAHGEIYAVSLASGMTTRLTHTPGEERWISFSSDGKEILYAAEREGSWNLYTMKRAIRSEPYFFAATEFVEEPLIESDDDSFQPLYSPDNTKVIYLKNRITLMLYDRKTKESSLIVPDNHMVSYIDGDQIYAFSPDGAHIAAKIIDRNRWSGEIAITTPENKPELVNVTNSGYDHALPVWRQDGAMIAWISYVGSPSISALLLNGEALADYQLTKEEKELTKKGQTPPAPDKKAQKKPALKLQKFEKERADDRKVTLSLVNRNYYMMRFSPDGETLYTFSNMQDSYKIHAINLREHKEKQLASIPHPVHLNWWYRPPFEMKLSKDGKTMLLVVAGKMMKLETASGKLTPVALSAEFSVDKYAEREYLFHHVYRTVKQKLYDPKMHGIDWDEMKKNYAQFLPSISNNFDFTEMLSEMLGELNVSHTGSGYIYRPPTGDSTAQLGTFFDKNYNGPGVKIAEIIHGGPLDIPGKTIEVGTLITKINGLLLESNPQQLIKLLNRKVGKSVRVSLLYKGRNEAVTVKPISWRSQSNLLYKRWVENNKKEVEKLSGGKLGYVHVRGMNQQSFQEIVSDILGRYNEKEGIVIDTRFNGGGWLHNQLAILFTGTSYSTFAYRGKSYFGGDPDNRWSKKSILLVSEGNYSDAHFFAYTYRALKIGKIVGMPVAGTTTAVWWPDMLDHSMYFGIPQIGVKDVDGDWLENKELTPDILIENKPNDISSGKDDQLEAAVKELLK